MKTALIINIDEFEMMSESGLSRLKSHLNRAKLEIRTPKQTILIGTNGTGKTSYLDQLVVSELKRGSRRVLIVVPDKFEWSTFEYVSPEMIGEFVGARKIIYQDGLLNTLLDRFHNGMLIFEDCRHYFGNSKCDLLHSLLIRRRYNGIDIVFSGHRFSDIPPKPFVFATHYALFKTIDNIVRRKNAIQNYEAMKEAQKRINDRAINDPHYFEIITV
ncbi:MAG: ATP-binding protein [Prolixibacteraceae bacterium]|jgi:hypothetical protein|nr:ATP-binding protein [Prolixibacteraceae bacterium]